MLAPKRVKYRKQMKGRNRGKATRGNTVAFGKYGLMSLNAAWISNRQIEAARVALTRTMKRDFRNHQQLKLRHQHHLDY